MPAWVRCLPCFNQGSQGMGSCCPQRLLGTPERRSWQATQQASSTWPPAPWLCNAYTHHPILNNSSQMRLPNKARSFGYNCKCILSFPNRRQLKVLSSCSLQNCGLRFVDNLTFAIESNSHPFAIVGVVLRFQAVGILGYHYVAYHKSLFL